MRNANPNKTCPAITMDSSSARRNDAASPDKGYVRYSALILM